MILSGLSAKGSPIEFRVPEIRIAAVPAALLCRQLPPLTALRRAGAESHMLETPPITGLHFAFFNLQSSIFNLHFTSPGGP
jgi:hypothetical protein